MDTPNILINLAVAIGTLALAFLTVYQLQLFKQEHRAAQARELGERIYTPLRVEIRSWSDPERVYENFSVKTWKELKEKYPYLTQRIPTDLAGLLNHAEDLQPHFAFLKSQVYRMIYEETDRLGRELAGVAQSNGTQFRAYSKDRPFLDFDAASVWVRETTLSEFVENYVKMCYPIEDWEVEVLVSGRKAGDIKDAEHITERVLEFLKGQVLAREFLERIHVINKLGVQVTKLVDHELSHS